MTVVIALKSANYLQPSGRNLEFEPGIIMAGDTRLSWIGVRRKHEDDHVKIDSIGNYAIAGYAGRQDIATAVLTKLEDNIKAGGDYSTGAITSLTKDMMDKEIAKHGALADTTVELLLAIKDIGTGKFLLYKMTSYNEFTPESQDGMTVIGSHGHYVKDIFEKVRDKAISLQNDPFRGPNVNLKENLALFIKLLLDNLIEVAVTQDGDSSLVGGETHLVILHSSGIEAMNPEAYKRLVL